MKPVKSGKGFYGEHYAKTLPRFNLVDVDLTILELKRRIFNQIKHIFKAESPLFAEANDAELNRSIVLHIFDNLPYINEGKYYTKKKATCEFCRSLHGQADTCDIQVSGVSANSEEGCSKIKVRDVLGKMEHNRDLIIGVIFREGSGASSKLLEPEYDQSHVKD